MMNFEITTKSRFDTLFNSILNYCTQLTDLVIAGHKSLWEESFPFEKKSKDTCNIKSLTLLGFTPTQRQSIDLLDQLPNLETLSLTNLFLKSSNSPPQESLFSICLPNASLKCLEINLDSNFSVLPDHRRVSFIKIVTDDPNQKAVYFSLLVVYYNSHSGTKVHHIVEDETEAAYQHSLSLPWHHTPTCWLIYCKSLKKLIIRCTEGENEHYYKKVDLVLSA